MRYGPNLAFASWWDHWLWMWAGIGQRRCYLVLKPGVGYKPRKLGSVFDPPNAVERWDDKALS